MSDNGDDERLPGSKFAETIALGTAGRLAAAGAGAWVVWKLLSQNPRARECKGMESDVRGRMRTQFQNPGQLSDATYREHIQVDKGIVRALSDDLPADDRVDIQHVENELAGRPLDVQAQTWNQLAHQATLSCIEDATDDETAMANLINSLPPWLQTLIAIVLSAKGIQVIITIIEKLLDFGKGGGGIMHLLGNYARTVREGIVGDPNVAEQAALPPEPGEEVAIEPSGSIVGSPRAIGQDAGVEAETIVHIATLLGIGAGSVTSIGTTAIDLVIQVTTLTEEDVATRPEVVALVALVIAAGVAIALADSPAPGPADIVGVALVAAVAAMVGVSIDHEGVREVAPDVYDDVA